MFFITILDKQLLASDPKQAGAIMKQKALVWKSLGENVKKWWKDEAHKHNMANHLSNTVTKGSMEIRYWQLISCLGRNISMLRRECGVESACFLAASSHEHHKSVQPSNNGYGSGNLLDRITAVKIVSTNENNSY